MLLTISDLLEYLGGDINVLLYLLFAYDLQLNQIRFHKHLIIYLIIKTINFYFFSFILMNKSFNTSVIRQSFNGISDRSELNKLRAMKKWGKFILRYNEDIGCGYPYPDWSNVNYCSENRFEILISNFKLGYQKSNSIDISK